MTPADQASPSSTFDIVCFSHLRWRFVFQRPQHLLSRWAREHRVFYVEEPVEHDGPTFLEITEVQERVWVVVPFLPRGTTPEEAERTQRGLVEHLIRDRKIGRYVLWFYSPAAVPLARNLEPLATVYDCMDELSAFEEAARDVAEREGELFDSADLVFTGGQSLFEAKRERHRHVHLFPSSVDVPHFASARTQARDPEDQAGIGRPRLGFFGVIDERLDRDLLAGIARLRPDWQIVMVGPVVKIPPEALPTAPNIHYLGAKPYEELPAYVGGWDLAILPFARNAATRFISPTKTPEYLAAGRPVVSTSITDVVRPYRDLGLVRIADDPEGFVAAAETAMAEDEGERLG
ncbi:MAG TPA: glycosyltransferase, partial [Actinomycetota bacterium]|nr:glycosyltransferase [Actinomycetota bacterium]